MKLAFSLVPQSNLKNLKVNFELYQRVALSRNLPKQQLKAGDVATLVDFAPHPSGSKDGCVLDVCSATKESIPVVSVPVSNIKSLKNNEVLAVRSLTKAS